ncbi:unnamed protein product [Rhizoctonia solani]|uniref:Response regulatory domain-containing protein n=1 Tax=Rhizoctonia solani TaxID=456999 RepID=A0A8H3BX90_9AGAM|nr:unnamed protein product [Rhizoctonia solani]
MSAPPPPPSRVSPAGFAPTPRDARAPASMLDEPSPVPMLPKALSAGTLASQQWPSLPPTPSNTATSTPNPPANQISMPFIKRHIRRRLTNAKETCDKELHKVIHSITIYVEERLREPSEPDFESYLHDLGNHGVLTNPMTDDESDDDHDVDYRSRQVSASSSPNSFRRPLGLPTRSIASTSSYGEASPSRKASDPLTRQHMAPPPAPNWQQTAPLARRMSRSRPHPGSLPIGPPSNSGSRPASRSRSPLPSAHHESQTVSSSPRTGTNSRRLSRMMDYEEAVDPFMSTLHEMTAIATDVVDMSIAQITSQPKACTEIVQKVQTIGRAWDEHPDWHGRAWYVQLLLAVAGLSRVVEWWEAEKQFWNFDEDDESEMEPMVFVMKPSSQPASANLSSARDLPEVRSPLSRASSSGTRGTPLDTAGAVSGEITSEGLPENSTLLAPEISQSTEPEQGQPQTDEDQAQENAQETETLRIRAEEAQAVTIVLELALDGEELLWTNRSWSEIIGSNPEDVIGTAITRLLAPEHADVFVKSTRQLREDDSHTIEVVFQMRIEAGTPEPVYQQFEGKGMLMLDRFSGEPTHTMWVIKPVGAAEADDVAELELPPAMNQVPQSRPVVTLRRASTDSRLGILPRPFSHAPVLCRICECQIPDWFFEKHNETCHELHRLEAEIGEHNDTISDLRTTIRGLTTSLDRASPVAVPEYRGVSLVNPSPSPLLGMPTQQVLRPHGPHAPLSNRLQRGSLRKQQHHTLQLLDDILQTAQEIAIPALREDQHDIPIERQRLMSPPSEHKIETVQKWTKPHTDDPGLNRLGNDVYAVIRHKVDSVNRLTNTIRYAEKVRREWEELVELERIDAEPLEPLPEGDEPLEEGEDTEEERDRGNAEDQAHEGDDVSSTTSEYAFGRRVSSEPTPMAPSPAPADQPAENSEAETPTESGSASTSTPESIPIATPAPRPPSMIVPQTFQGILTTRSSTPSSISSPLATAAPIVAAVTPEHMSLNNPNELSPQTVRTRRSVQNVSLLVTPPMSPSVAPQDDKTAKKNRRMSTIQPIPRFTSDFDGLAAFTFTDYFTRAGGGTGPSISRPIPISKEGQPPDEDFGAFSYKNLPVLKQANDDVIRKMRTDQMAPMTYTLSEPTPQQHHRRRSVSQKIKKPLNLESRVAASGSTNPPSPSTSTSSIASSPSRGSMQPSTPASSMSGHVRRPSEFGAVERFKSNHLDNDGVRRNSMPSRLRTSSISSQDMNAPLPQQAGEEQWTGEPRAISPVQSRPASVVPKMPPPPAPAQPAPQSDRGLVVLIAEDNPISSKVLETLLTRMGCRCVVVGDGSEAISVAMGDIKFDCILMDYQMPSVDGEVAARLIKTTKNKNSNVPIVAVSAYSGYEDRFDKYDEKSWVQDVARGEQEKAVFGQSFLSGLHVYGSIVPPNAEPTTKAIAELLKAVHRQYEQHEQENKRRQQWETDTLQKQALHQQSVDIRLAAMQQQIDSLRGYPTQPYPQPQAPAYAPGIPAPAPMYFAQPQPPTQQFSVTPPAQQQPQQAGQSTPSSARQPRSFKRLKQYQPNESEGDESMMNMSVNMNGQMMPQLPEPSIAPMDEERVHALARKKNPVGSIPSAMRAHILRLMALNPHEALPPSHVEDQPAPEGIIRFVWEKTPKSSPHNGRMKQIVIEDLQRSRHLYPLVPTADFAAPLLDACFDQAFTTLRGKWRIQCGEPGLESKVEAKAKRTRRHNRKKSKLNHRVAARQNLPQFAHTTFDPALIPEVMSSESSEDEADGKKDFQTRGFSWRSQRAQNLYQCLDEEENSGRDRALRRGGARRERRDGGPKVGDPLPPKGTPLWMISKAWLRTQTPDTLAGLGLVDDRSFDWRGFHDLGDSSGDEGEPVMDEGTMGMVDSVSGMGVVGDYSQGEMGGMQAQGPVGQVGHPQQVQGQPTHVAHMQHVQHVGYAPQGHMG